MKSLLCVFVVLLSSSLAFSQLDAAGNHTTTASTTTTATTTTTPDPPTTQNKTTTSHPNTTTEAPTTTAVPVTTTPAPKPTPATPPVLSYFVRDTKNISNICFLLKAGIRLEFNYTSTDNKTHIKLFNVTSTSGHNESHWQNVTGSCGNVSQTMVIQIGNGWSLTLRLNQTKKGVELDSAIASFSLGSYPDIFPKAKNPSVKYNPSMRNISMWETPKKNGYKCNDDEPIPFNLTLSPLANVQTYGLQVEAFRKSNTTNYGDAYTQCPQDNEISNIVPIAVGAALGALVLIVLIAYLVGRKRNIRGYESV